MLRVGLTGGLGSGKSTAAHLFADLGVHVLEADEVGRALMEPGQAVYAEIVRHFGNENGGTKAGGTKAGGTEAGGTETGGTEIGGTETGATGTGAAKTGAAKTAGAKILRADGTLDRQVLADLAFRQGRLQELNRIVHPPVIALQEQWVRDIFAADINAIAMIESALIFEADRTGSAPGWRQRFDRIVLVTASDEQKVARYVARLSAPGGQLHARGSNERESLAEAARIRLAAQIPDSEKAAMSDYVIDNSGTLPEMERAVNDLYWKLKAEAEARSRGGS